MNQEKIKQVLKTISMYLLPFSVLSLWLATIFLVKLFATNHLLISLLLLIFCLNGIITSLNHFLSWMVKDPCQTTSKKT
jgi:O-antigen/teichoic acid export membrane protein